MNPRIPRDEEITLEPVQAEEDYLEILYRLLKQREPYSNISHRKMPSFRKHKDFVLSKPYKDWRFIKRNGEIVGTLYVTFINEIGIFIVRKHRNKGIGTRCIKKLFQRKRERFVANISHENKRATHLFKRLGFKMIQHTYERMGK